MTNANILHSEGTGLGEQTPNSIFIQIIYTYLMTLLRFGTDIKSNAGILAECHIFCVVIIPDNNFVLLCW